MISSHDRIHHDGSSLYVDRQTPRIGKQVTLRLFVPDDLAVDQVLLRYPVDAEPLVVAATKSKHGWWNATLTMTASVMTYRWLVVGKAIGNLWITAAGNVLHEVTDSTDFKITTFSSIPRWATKSVAYQIFPDRYSRSSRSYDIPEWAVARPWQVRPEGRSKDTGVEYFGGDIWGIIERLDHISSLGVNLIYTTPFFPARSTHRYDASTFAHVDPLLGGDQALIALVEAAHTRGIKVIGDITLNHTGEMHEWFLAAQAGDEEKRSFYYFDPTIKDGYVSWLGHKSLPKLNFASNRLRELLITDHDSVLRRFLKPPFNLDGWRVDVANMMARLGDYDENHQIARLTRWAIEQEGPEKILIGEHNHNAGPDLPGDGWFGVMNYTSFQRPVWYWLSTSPSDLEFIPGVPVRSASTETFLASIRTGHASMSWKTLNASWNLLGSHDSARVRTMVGSSERQSAAVFLMCTLPGTPMIFAEDEIGAEGRWGEDSRTAFPWDSTWNEEILGTYRSLIQLRTSNDTLVDGGLRFVDAGEDYVVYLRESEHEALLVIVARSESTVSLPLASIGYTNGEHLLGQEGRIVDGHLLLSMNAGGSIWRLR